MGPQKHHRQHGVTDGDVDAIGREGVGRRRQKGETSQ